MRILSSRVAASAAVAALAALASVCMIAAPAQATPALTTVVINNYTFTYEDGNTVAGTTITAYAGSATTLRLPDGISVFGVSYPLTGIGPSAFATKGLTSVTITPAVTWIGEFAFSENSLTTVSLPSSVTTIGAYAFSNNLLTTVTIPDTVTTLGDWAFVNNLLTSFTLPASIVAIPTGLFANNNLTSISIPDSITSIGNDAFNMNPLDTVLMEGPVPTSIGTLVFDAGGGATPVVSYHAHYPDYTQPTWTAGGEVYSSQALVTATFDAGIGTGGTTTDVAAESSVAAPTPPTAEGHRFLGWTAIDGVGPPLAFPITLANDDTVYALWEAREVASPAKAGAGNSFSVSGSGFEPGESVEVWLHSDPVLLTTLTASGTGTISASLLLASGTPAGLHQLVFTGTTTGTTSYDMTVEVVLAESGFDSGPLSLVALGLVLAGAGLIVASHQVAAPHILVLRARHDRGGHSHR